MTSDCGKFVLSAALLVNVLLSSHVSGLFDFEYEPIKISDANLKILEGYSDEVYKDSLELSTRSLDGLNNFERNLLDRGVTVQNGSISHQQVIATLPQRATRPTSLMARKLVKASQYFYNNQCVPKNIPVASCAQFLSGINIGRGSYKFWEKCMDMNKLENSESDVFRRLLPANYKDGLYEMNDKLPSPRKISGAGLHHNIAAMNEGNNYEDADGKNLAMVQWAQFIEHDASKPVTATLVDRLPIECCADGNYGESPRNLHPTCAPMIEANGVNKRGRESCLNYVRSAVSINDCFLGPADQLNEASGYLDLSQLYGSNTEPWFSELRVGSYGRLRMSEGDLLPKTHFDSHHSFCAIEPLLYSNCFQSGDSRVNSNPCTTTLYTTFLRLHNRIAQEIKNYTLEWYDEHYFNETRRITVDIYRSIVFKEWLPVALGQRVADLINSEPLQKNDNSEFRVSNEFGVAAIRFYFSMMPNTFKRFPPPLNNEITPGNESETSTALFNLLDEMYKSDLLKEPGKVNEFLTSMLNQKAMKMDASYAESLVEYRSDKVPTRQNILAFDIQRGRDHGLQGYVKYLEHCEGRAVNSWADLAGYIAPEEITKLRSIYDQVADIDLIVGGIAERPAVGSTVGPTFTCILGEQFAKMRQWHYNLQTEPARFNSKYKNLTGAQVLCITSELREVPKNIFLIPSNKNPLVSCSDLLKSINY